MLRDYIETYTGKKVYLPDPEPESIDILDISRALSFAPRFAGHINQHYSVGMHSLMVEACVQKLLDQVGIQNSDIRLQALLHDATEAYLCDIPTPFKGLITGYREMEAELWRAVSERFGVPFELDPLVKKADQIMLYAERKLLKPLSGPWKFELDEESVRFGLRIMEENFWWRQDFITVENDFLAKFEELY